jgi:hypothetical protein
MKGDCEEKRDFFARFKLQIINLNEVERDVRIRFQPWKERSVRFSEKLIIFRLSRSQSNFSL